MKIFISLQLFLWLPFLTVIYSTYTPCDRCVHRATPTTLAAIELRLYTGATLNDYTSVRIENALTLLKKLDNTKPTAIYIFGWLSNPDRSNVRAIVKAYLARGDHNVILLDWHEIASQFYTYSLLSIDGIGYTLATALNKLVSNGFSPSGLHLIGHSFGAQISGFVGRYVNFRLAKITGLDPTGVGFYGVKERLTANDAEFVLVIHSDIFLYGINLSLGHADFYPNGGFRPQPGCPLLGIPFGDRDFCSHNRACDFYAESLWNERAFLGLKCDTYTKFQNGSCFSNEKVVMGYGTPTTTRGNFYLQTNSETLFNRGEDGLIYNPSDSLINGILQSI